MGILRTWDRLAVSVAFVCAVVACGACGPPPDLRLRDGSGGWSGPSVGAGGGTWVPDVAVPACAYDGDACERDVDCCSGQCFDGVCASSCAPYAPCTQDTDCCSGEVCATDQQGDTYCQSTSPGPAGCQSSGAVCTTDADCCSGVCDPNQLTCY